MLCGWRKTAFKINVQSASALLNPKYIFPIAYLQCVKLCRISEQNVDKHGEGLAINWLVVIKCIAINSNTQSSSIAFRRGQEKFMANYHLLIVDDNLRQSSMLADRFIKEGGWSADICCNAADALDFFTKKSPDIALIDMLMPEMDGAEFMMQCRERKLGEKTKFIALSSLTSEEIIKLTQSLGMAYFIAMPTSPDSIYRRVARLVGALQEGSAATKRQKRAEKDYDADREQIITNYLHIIGISPHVSGYRYLKIAIEYSVENYGKKLCVTTDIYPEVARICKSTPKRVERNIRTAIDRAWFHGNIEMQHKMFGYTVNDNKGRPTNKECIAMLTDRTVMRQKYR